MIVIAFTGGGTGGHIYPGLAVIARLTQLFGSRGLPGYRIVWLGANTGMDRSLVEAGGLEFFGIPSGRLRRYFSLKTIPDMFRVLGGFLAARSILKKLKPALLFSKGGFVSVPPCAAAASLGIPVFTHESDFSPGLATRINLRFVARTKGRIFTAYAETAAFLAPAYRGMVTVSGNPVRPAFRAGSDAGSAAALAAAGRAFLGLGPDEQVLLVLGGSQGAREINDLVKDALPELTKYYTVVHQTGPDKDGDLRPGGRYKPYPYIGEEMPQVLAAAALVLGRSGAGTVWESAALGKPMVLIPLRGSGTRGDQVENARFFQEAGAAVMLLPQAIEDAGGADAARGAAAGSDTIAPAELVRVIRDLAVNREKLAAMAGAAANIGRTDGAAVIAEAIAEAIGAAARVSPRAAPA
ncbi:MAG: UDP-N-acetylglucosamine--N-acetylmuramyl-(pentapeptide) pyrophosphoryl-undecaprenol N-acetylglucosamine transferase [Treponema sp.]|jgi:UDP-N-acetylglucosamine--N-acetylmuramyl-(pentapeptide) pyrophosphoryl-undecaprenol N-acetylglucosamine transferase|nr:UDP-N-acetylglucosamine--N-acetylmuramyl-(pentapeptide) pyrophosphoryl-undecaprenol N-acetylglucosamine transferase [Treponema sp.]